MVLARAPPDFSSFGRSASIARTTLLTSSSGQLHDDEGKLSGHTSSRTTKHGVVVKVQDADYEPPTHVSPTSPPHPPNLDSAALESFRVCFCSALDVNCKARLPYLTSSTPPPRCLRSVFVPACALQSPHCPRQPPILAPSLPSSLRGAQLERLHWRTSPPMAPPSSPNARRSFVRGS